MYDGDDLEDPQGVVLAAHEGLDVPRELVEVVVKLWESSRIGHALSLRNHAHGKICVVWNRNTVTLKNLYKLLIYIVKLRESSRIGHALSLCNHAHGKICETGIEIH